jgi:hypothetical protein
MTRHRQKSDPEFPVIGRRRAPGVKQVQIQPGVNQCDRDQPRDSDQN